MTTVNTYPQHGKAALVHDKSLLISEFMAFLEARNIVLAQWVGGERLNEYLSPSMETIEELISEFFGVNLTELKSERAAMLEEYRQLTREG